MAPAYHGLRRVERGVGRLDRRLTSTRIIIALFKYVITCERVNHVELALRKDVHE